MIRGLHSNLPVQRSRSPCRNSSTIPLCSSFPERIHAAGTPSLTPFFVVSLVPPVERHFLSLVTPVRPIPMLLVTPAKRSLTWTLVTPDVHFFTFSWCASVSSHRFFRNTHLFHSQRAITAPLTADVTATLCRLLRTSCSTTDDLFSPRPPISQTSLKIALVVILCTFSMRKLSNKFGKHTTHAFGLITYWKLEDMDAHGLSENHLLTSKGRHCQTRFAPATGLVSGFSYNAKSRLTFLTIH